MNWSLISLAATAVILVAGMLSAVRAVMTSRSPQAAVAWAIGLCTFPILALPLFWVFGRTRFYGYVAAHRALNRDTSPIATRTIDALPDALPDRSDLSGEQKVFEALAGMPFTNLNHIDLLRDGRATFDAIFESIDAAEEYVLIQFYIYRDDELGKQLHDRLVEAEDRGVEVYLLFDEIGCAALPMEYIRSLRESGIEISGFKTRQGRHNRFQINFRNHRKVVIVDGTVAYVGGHNVGDEYLGKDERYGHWRDTHLRLTGPAVLAAQMSFVSDWYWAVRRIPELNWQPTAATEGDQQVLVMPSGPSDEQETYKLALLQAINTAETRFWIVSPYFVPDSDVMSALTLAALRGVDIRIMLPLNPDHRLVYMAGYTYIPQLHRNNIRFYRYGRGFLHQKVLLKDDDLAILGTANADNRSFRLNFEISVVGVSPEFTGAVEAMLLEDFTECEEVSADTYTHKPFWFRFTAQVCRLFAPIL